MDNGGQRDEKDQQEQKAHPANRFQCHPGKQDRIDQEQPAESSQTLPPGPI